MTKWYTSDTHFSHASTWEKFKRPDGTPLRPFSSTEEMDETLIDNWNKVIKPNDTVIHLGDVVINRKALHILHRLNGHKRLCRGNHDIFKMQDYINGGFEEIYGVYVLPKIRVICSHIPIHKDSLERWNQNWHGHLHFGTVKLKTNHNTPDKKYRNLSVEMTDFAPIQHDELVADMEQSLNIKV